MKEERESGKLKKWESIIKIIGIPLIGIIVTFLVQNNAEKNREQQFTLSEKNRKTQLFADIMSKRESSDSEIRASMFKTLMENFLGTISKDKIKKEDIQDIRDKVVFLKLLLHNFQEYFNAKPLFEDLYERIESMENDDKNDSIRKKQLRDLKNRLIKTSRSAAKKQEIMLARVGESFPRQFSKGETKCISLYNTHGIRMYKHKEGGNFEHVYNGKCMKRSNEKNALSANNRDNTQPKNGDYDDEFYYSIDVTIDEVHDHDIKITLNVVRDFFINNVYDRSVLKQDNLRFTVSYFDLPFMDNTQLFNGSRFALILQDIFGQSAADITILTFREEFMSLRDRPFFEEMLNKLRKDEFNI